MRVRVGATATEGQTEGPAGSLPEPALPQSELEQPALPQPEEHAEGEEGCMTIGKLIAGWFLAQLLVCALADSFVTNQMADGAWTCEPHHVSRAMPLLFPLVVMVPENPRHIHYCEVRGWK